MDSFFRKLKCWEEFDESSFFNLATYFQLTNQQILPQLPQQEQSNLDHGSSEQSAMSVRGC